MSEGKILLINWDNYPNNPVGGVYAWEKALIDSLTDFEFAIFNVVSNPNVSASYQIPPHVTEVLNVPLFGCFRYQEFYEEKGLGLLSRIVRTRPSTINIEFANLYDRLLHNLFSHRCNHELLNQTIYDLHNLFLTIDVKKCIENPLAWDKYIEFISSDHLFRNISIKDAHFIFQLLQKMLQLLSVKIPKSDLVHCSLAWIPAIIAIVAKWETNCPVIVTEHGVAFRDLALYHSTYFSNGASSILWKVVSSNLIKAIYSVADLIAPVCFANAAWEGSLGAARSKLKVLYNGIDIKKFRPLDDPSLNNGDVGGDGLKKPTIVYVGRVEVLKDVMNLIQSLKYVQERIPDFQCLIYGISTDLDYSLRCLDMVSELKLGDNIKFMDKTSQPERVYNNADVVVLSSIAEGFPYSIIEAMACRRAIVSTDVGGVREALEGCGILVRSRHPFELGSAIVKVLNDQNLREQLASAAMKRVHERFTLDQCISSYRIEYKKLINRYKEFPTGYFKNPQCGTMQSVLKSEADFK